MVGWLKFNIIEKIPFMVHLEIQCITFKTKTSFIAHPWIKLSVVGLEVYSAHDWRAATSVQRAPVTWREWGLWFTSRRNVVKCVKYICMKLPYVAQQVGNAYFYRLTEIKELSGSLWWMHEGRNLLKPIAGCGLFSHVDPKGVARH